MGRTLIAAANHTEAHSLRRPGRAASRRHYQCGGRKANRGFLQKPPTGGCCHGNNLREDGFHTNDRIYTLYLKSVEIQNHSAIVFLETATIVCDSIWNRHVFKKRCYDLRIFPRLVLERISNFCVKVSVDETNFSKTQDMRCDFTDCRILA